MGKWVGGRGQFQSRVDGMEGGGRSACVIMKEDNGLVSLQAASSRGGGNRANKKGFLFCVDLMGLKMTPLFWPNS